MRSEGDGLYRSCAVSIVCVQRTERQRDDDTYSRGSSRLRRMECTSPEDTGPSCSSVLKTRRVKFQGQGSAIGRKPTAKYTSWQTVLQADGRAPESLQR